VTPAADPNDELTDQEYYDLYYADIWGGMDVSDTFWGDEGDEEEEEAEEDEEADEEEEGEETFPVHVGGYDLYLPGDSDDIPDESEPIPDESEPVTNQSGHRQDDPFPVDTQEGMEHTVETGGFHALEKALGMDMPQIYENYALGNFTWQTSSTIPEWLSPNLSKLHGGNEQYNYLLEKYSDDYKMMQNLERVDTAMRAPYVLNYLDTTHNELRSTYHNGLSHDQIHNITNSNMPGFAYNSQGHIVLRDDKTIDHSFNHNREVVHTFDTSGQVASEHTQLDFAKEAQELSAN
jgi:hypothetical protein